RWVLPVACPLPLAGALPVYDDGDPAISGCKGLPHRRPLARKLDAAPELPRGIAAAEARRFEEGRHLHVAKLDVVARHHRLLPGVDHDISDGAEIGRAHV